MQMLVPNSMQELVPWRLTLPGKPCAKVAFRSRGALLRCMVDRLGDFYTRAPAGTWASSQAIKLGLGGDEAQAPVASQLPWVILVHSGVEHLSSSQPPTEHLTHPRPIQQVWGGPWDCVSTWCRGCFQGPYWVVRGWDVLNLLQMWLGLFLLYGFSGSKIRFLVCLLYTT